MATQPRQTAAERREAILESAITEMDLFLAVVERVFRRTLELFQLATGRTAAG
jgi:hypothetical protein